MKEQEQESIEPLKYQLRQWRELVNKYLPPTDCDRDDVEAIEALIKKAVSNSALSDAHKNALMMAFAEGYEAGHNDTVESAYTDATDRAIDWLIDAKKAGIIQGVERKS